MIEPDDPHHGTRLRTASAKKLTKGKSPSEFTSAACVALTGNAATCCPGLIKCLGCDQKPRTTGTIGAGLS
jgi:hypothetical protein